MKRKLISIDEEKCNGCGLCIPGCPEGAIRIIDGKARLVSDVACDGLGACLGHCPEGAISVEEREAEAYDERTVIETISKQGESAIRAHLEHLKEHRQFDAYRHAITYLKENGIPIPSDWGSSNATAPNAMQAEQFKPAPQPTPQPPPSARPGSGCPGSQSMTFARDREGGAAAVLAEKQSSQLTHWPIQMHLLSPGAPQYAGADLLLAADCVAFSVGDFHKEWLKNKSLAIACPKLDSGQEVYAQKLVELIDVAKVNTLTVMIMQVPCCRGLLLLAQHAVAKASRKVPIKLVVVGLQGEVLQEQWL